MKLVKNDGDQYPMALGAKNVWVAESDTSTCSLKKKKTEDDKGDEEPQIPTNK